MVFLSGPRQAGKTTLASLARDLQISPTTLGRYLEILEALHIVFTLRPFHRNIVRALLKEPKVYFFDTGLVQGDEGARFEKACATMLLRHAHFLQDSAGRAMSLHYVRDKEGREIDFVLCEKGEPAGFAECKLSDPAVPSYLVAIAERFPGAGATLLVRHLRQLAAEAPARVSRRIPLWQGSSPPAPVPRLSIPWRADNPPPARSGRGRRL